VNHLTAWTYDATTRISCGGVLKENHAHVRAQQESTGGLEVTVQSSLGVPVACRKGHRGHSGVGRSLDGSVGVAWKGHERAAVIDGFARSCRRGHVGCCGGAPDPRHNRWFS